MKNSNLQTAAPAQGGQAIDDAMVLEHLKHRPDFFRQYPEAIANLSLPHNSGSAVSLVERQVAVLRERSIQTRRKLSQLIDIAKDNDQLFDRTQQLVIALLKARSVEQLCCEVISQFGERFGVEKTSVLFLLDENDPLADSLQPEHRRARAEALHAIGHLLESGSTFCGLLRSGEAECLFGQADGTASAAIASRTLPGGATLLLSVANSAADHYSQQTGTLFIDHIADILALRTDQLQD